MVTTWAEQTRDLIKSWTDVQAQLWETWLDSSTRFGSAEGKVAGDWVSVWSKGVRKMMSPWLVQADAVPRDVVERLFAGEETFLRFVELWMGALKVVAPKMDLGGDWVELLRRAIDQLKEDTARGGFLENLEGASAAMGEIPELWSLYVKQMERLLGPWAQVMLQAPWTLREAATGDREASSRLFTVVMDTWESTIGRYLTSPQVGYTREISEKLMRGFDAWVDYSRAVVEFQTEVNNTGNRALEHLLAELVERGERGEAVTSFQQLFDLWVDTSEKTYFDLFSSEGFAQLQGRALNSYMNYRQREREIMEEVLEGLGIPTRQEVDQVHRNIYDLKVELRYMKRELASARNQLASLQAGPAVPKGTPPAPKRKRSTKNPTAKSGE